MMNVKSIALIAVAVVAASATSAPAGTKYAANLVSNGTVDPPVPPTLSPKSSIKVADKGAIQVSLSGVVDGGGMPVTTSTSYNDGTGLDGSEYIVIIKLFIPAVAVLFPVIELPVPVDLKAGKGKTKLNASSFFALIPPGTGRGVEITGSEVWGPLSAAKAPACEAIVSSSLPVSLGANDPTCRGGDHIGMSGMYIPNP
jgi:hypothetical protein